MRSPSGARVVDGNVVGDIVFVDPRTGTPVDPRAGSPSLPEDREDAEVDENAYSTHLEEQGGNVREISGPPTFDDADEDDSLRGSDSDSTDNGVFFEDKGGDSEVDLTKDDGPTGQGRK